MAEKNTESTAVNQLIELVATAKPLPPDPTEDLMFRPARPAPKQTRKLSAPRMTSNVPVADMEPLPRARTPVGTQQGLATLNLGSGAHASPPPPVPTIKAPPPAIRVSTAPPTRGSTIPPIAPKGSFGAAPLTLDDEDAEVTNPGPSMTPMTRPTKPSVPPPPLPRPSGSGARPSLQTTRDFAYPVVPSTPAVSTPPPPTTPVAAPFASASLPTFAPAVLEPSASASWENEIGTQQVVKTNDWKAIAGKLIGPMVVLVIAGIFIGGYFAFDGDGGKKRAPKPAEGQKITMSVTGGDGANAGANAAASVDGAASADGASADGASADGANAAAANTTAMAKADATAADAANPNAMAADADTTAMAKADVAKADAAKTTAMAKTDAAKADAAKTTPTSSAASDKPITPPNLAASSGTVVPASVKPSTARPVLVDVRIDSNPTGATVTLIDRGKSTFLGTTPMSAAVDVARKYELVFSYEGRATVVESLDPTSQKRVSVRLSRAKSSSSKASPSSSSSSSSSSARAKSEAPKGKTAPASGIDAALEKAEKAEKAEPAKAEAAKPEAGGDGTLMISSKPPCEIVIDGKPTGLTTPQRAITLPAGAHKVTLVNTAAGIKKTISVQITADKPTKVIQDFMK